MQKNLNVLIAVRCHSSAGWNLGPQQVSGGLIEKKLNKGVFVTSQLQKISPRLDSSLRWNDE